jgi:hypothetical protein
MLGPRQERRFCEREGGLNGEASEDALMPQAQCFADRQPLGVKGAIEKRMDKGECRDVAQ